jgi:predicted membrane metal-binding protein
MTTTDPHSPVETIEKDALVAGYAAAGTVRGVEIAAIVLLGLLVCPPLAILAVVVVVPLLAIGLVVALLAAVITVPYVIVQRVRGHHSGHASLLAHRLRAAGHALFELAPHRIDAAARKLHAGR